MPKVSSNDKMVADAMKTIKKHMLKAWADLKADLGDDLKVTGRSFTFCSDTFKLYCDRDKNWGMLDEMCFCYNDDDDLWRKHGWEVSFEDEGNEKYCLNFNNIDYYSDTDDE